MEKVNVLGIRVPKGIVDRVAKLVLPEGQELVYYFPLAQHPETGEYTVRQTGRIINVVDTTLPRVVIGEDGMPAIHKEG